MTLTCDATVITCIANDYDFDQVFARQVQALAGPEDLVIAFSTSGRSPNVVAGLATARARGATTVLLCGASVGPAGAHADVVLAAPATETAPYEERIHPDVAHHQRGRGCVGGPLSGKPLASMTARDEGGRR